MFKTKGLVLALTFLICIFSATAFAKNSATAEMEKVTSERICSESDCTWQNGGCDYNEKGRSDKPEFTKQTEQKIYDIKDKITQEEGHRYNEGK